jgi:hypothetical protein
MISSTLFAKLSKTTKAMRVARSAWGAPPAAWGLPPGVGPRLGIDYSSLTS